MSRNSLQSMMSRTMSSVIGGVLGLLLTSCPADSDAPERRTVSALPDAALVATTAPDTMSDAALATAAPDATSDAALATAAPDAAPLDEPATAITAAAATPIAGTGDVTLRATELGRGVTSHSFQVEQRCPLERVELDVGLDSMPDGFVTLRTPWAQTVRLPAHWLQIEITKTWDWAELAALHGERGRSIAGEWVFASTIKGATYAGGTQTAAPMPTPRLKSVELRLFCAPAAPVTTASAVFPARSPRPGADTRALWAVTDECAVAAVNVAVELAAGQTTYLPLELVAPAGEVIRVGAARSSRLEKRLALASPARSRGIWELRAKRGGVTFTSASLAFECAE